MICSAWMADNEKLKHTRAIRSVSKWYDRYRHHQLLFILLNNSLQSSKSFFFKPPPRYLPRFCSQHISLSHIPVYPTPLPKKITSFLDNPRLSTANLRNSQLHKHTLSLACLLVFVSCAASRFHTTVPRLNVLCLLSIYILSISLSISNLCLFLLIL
jgi:hypothetical protein